MLPRILEPEVMDTPAEAADYDAMDHSVVNRRFVDDLLGALAAGGLLPAPGGPPLGILDVGTGTAQIPIELAARDVSCTVLAIDLADEMLALARRNIARAGCAGRVRVAREDAKHLSSADGTFDVVVSNSIVHHIPEPRAVLAEMRRVLRAGGLLFVRDLFRPASRAELDRLVQTYAGGESAHARQMFRDSLHAALTVEEVRALAIDLGLPPGAVEATSDRHWTLSALC